MKINNFFKNPYIIDNFSEQIPQKVRQYFKESVLSYNNQIPNAAAIMCKKTIIEICVNKKAKGKNLIKKLENIDADKKIINFLNKISDINTEDINSQPLAKMTVKKFIEFSAAIIEKIYL